MVKIQRCRRQPLGSIGVRLRGGGDFDGGGERGKRHGLTSFFVKIIDCAVAGLAADAPGCNVPVVRVTKDSFILHVLECDLRRDLDAGTVFELKAFGGLGYGRTAHAGGDFFGGQGNTSFLAMLHKPALDFFADVTDVVKKIDFLLSNEYL